MQYQSRRSLALRKTSRSQERDEALQIQRAMEESLRELNNSERAVIEAASPADVARNTKREEVVDSEEDTPLEKDGASVDCLRANCGRNSSEIALSEEEEKEKEKEKEEPPQRKHSSAVEVLKCQQINKKTNENVEWSSEEEDDDDEEEVEEEEDDDDDEDEDDTTEGESSDASEDFRCKRKKAPASKKSKERVVLKDSKQVPVPQVKKARSVRVTAIARPFTSDSVNKVKLVMQVTPSEKFQKETVKNPKDTKEIGKNMSTKKCQISVRPRKQEISGNATLFHNVSTPSSAIFQPQSPTLIHRRVIGLSRRFRPPPLHPYLPKIQS